MRTDMQNVAYSQLHIIYIAADCGTRLKNVILVNRIDIKCKVYSFMIQMKTNGLIFLDNHLKCFIANSIIVFTINY